MNGSLRWCCAAYFDLDELLLIDCLRDTRADGMVDLKAMALLGTML